MLRFIFRTPTSVARLRLRSFTSQVRAVSSSMGSSSSHQSNPSWKVEKYTPSAMEWPYTQGDFERDDESPDSEFYSSPKFVTHIDENAVENLSRYYDHVLPKEGTVLDFCSSWVSHYPDRIKDDSRLRVFGLGLNQAELDHNPFFGPAEEKRRLVQDLNIDPDLSQAFAPDVQFDASTCTVSIDYLSKAVQVLSSLRRRTKENGSVHLAISNRAFWHKVVRRWMEVNERGRLELVGDYLWFSGWREVEIVTIVDVKSDNGSERYSQSFMGINSREQSNDPLWVVRAKNVKSLGEEAVL
ncbi:uncharacterized protein PV09_03167 [Verruconis gallopava]|uniref:Methyltransferase type 11 domain-containing protein n=1 Tax=Verruconis gallopava TaxID=253628 RepID=A0A0D2AGA7_9PEZI|nr:uncharacterized protein PV09_03167 [Verruconis gallopava]KIW05983.1 hypothetical protein PV09_03167 [Verruconis gallopava]